MDFQELENLANAATQALVNHDNEAIKGILRQCSLEDFDAPNQFRFPKVATTIFRMPAKFLFLQDDGTMPGNSDPFDLEVNYEDALGNILLRLAASFSDYEFAKLLLEKGADVSSTSKRGLTALHIAVIRTDYELIRLLLEKGADVNMTDIHKKTVLHYACDGNFSEVIESNYELIRFLLEKGVDVTMRHIHRKTALHYAACDGKSSEVNKSDYELIRFLLEKGADVTMRDIYRKTALHYACDGKSSEIIKLLIKISPAYILNLGDNRDRTPFDYACRRQSPDVIQYMLSQGSSVVLEDPRLDGPLICAVSHNKAEYATSIASILLTAGAKMDHQLLIVATKRAAYEATENDKFLDLCMLLIDRGCDLSAVDEEGQTALHIAAKTNQEILVRKLLICGPHLDIDKRDRKGSTPLLNACEYGNRQLVDLLINSGASLRGRHWKTTFKRWRRSYKKLSEEKKKLYNYVIERSKECLTLENFCYIIIRKNIRNVEKDAKELRLPPLLLDRLQLKNGNM